MTQNCDVHPVAQTRPCKPICAITTRSYIDRSAVRTQHHPIPRDRWLEPSRRRQAEAHRLRARGLRLADIASRLGVGIRAVSRYLSRPNPTSSKKVRTK